MTASNSAPAHLRLIQILSDERDMIVLLSSPKDIFDEAQRLSFKDERTNSDTGDQEDPNTNLPNNDDEGSTSGGKGSKPRKKPFSSRSPWARFLKMETFSLSPHIQQYLERNKKDPLPFFDGGKVSPKKMLQYQGQDRFVAAFRFVRDVRRERIKERSRWFFIMLMFHDLIKLIFPNARRVGKLMVGEIVGYFGALVGSVLPAAKELRLELNTWCRWIIAYPLADLA